MTRMFSTFAMAGWTGYHAVSAFAFAAPAVLNTANVQAFAADPVTTGATLTASVHAMLATASLSVAAMLHVEAERHRAQAVCLAVLAVGIALAASLSLAGAAGAAPGLYAACVALTLAAFAFDRFVSPLEEEVDHDAFMLRAAEIGARMGRARKPGERPMDLRP